jgi:RHS repeat-associated protein
MPTWWVTQPYISLWLKDEPLGYQPAVGPRISFQLAFKQRETLAGFNTNIFSIGKKWNFSWLSYVAQDTNANNVVHFPGGGQRTFYAAADYLTNTRLTGNTNAGFTISYADGSQDLYGFIVTNGSGAFQEAFLTQRLNAQGQMMTLAYFNYNPANPVVRLRYVIDGDGRTNSVYYVTANPYSTNLISEVVDAFGRTNSLAYDGVGHLTNSTDVVGISSSFAYDTNDWVSGLTTPYGTTSFSITDTSGTNVVPNGRSVLVTQPDGGHQLYLYQDAAPSVASSYATNVVPNTGAFNNTLDNSDLNLRNTFYWGARQYASLTTTNIASFSANDFRKAKMRHWLRSLLDSVGGTLSMERDPSPDAGGSIEGQKTWYDYTGKANAEYEGTQIMPLFVARVLPDGTTSFTRTDRNSLGAAIDEISTYSANGSVALRTNLYNYAANGIDMLAVTNALGVQISKNIYNANHEVVTNYDALNEMTVNTYDGSQRPTSTTLPSGLVTTNLYGADGFLAQRIDIGFATNSYTYVNDLVFTHTDPRGLTVTNLWDNLQRPVGTIFPDSSTISNQYTFLDLTATKDRLGNWTYFGFDSMRRKIAETNAIGAVTLYDYCTCGSLDSIRDALGNFIYLYYDNQGNQTNIVYADGYSVSRTIDLLKRVVSTTDSGGNSVTNTYNNQSLVISVNNSAGQLSASSYDILDRATNSVDANGVSVGVTFDNLNRPLAKSYPDGGVEHWGYTPSVSGTTSYTNQIGNVTLYGRDAMNRKTNEISAGVTTNSFTYNGANDLLTLTDGRNQTTSFGIDLYGNVTNKLDALNRVMFNDAYDADNQLTSRWTPEKGYTFYVRDAVGNTTQIRYPQQTNSYAYDALNQLTNMVDAAGVTTRSYTPAGFLASEGGLWSSDTVSLGYANRLRTSLSIGSSWSQNYTYNPARRLTGITSPAGAFNYQFLTPNSYLPTSISLPNAASITNSYDVVARLTQTELKNYWGHTLDGYAYQVNALGLRTNIIRNLGLTASSISVGYNSIDEITSWTAQETNGVTRQNEKLAWAYDAAQNLRLRTNGALVQSFTVDAANELTNLTRTGTLTVSGNTPAPATNVTVNGLSAQIYGDFTFASTNHTLADGNNSFTNVAQNVYGLTVTNTFTANLPASASLQSDANGNLTNDGLRTFAYDSENQLTNVTVANQFKKDFVYDGLNRLRIKREYGWTGSAWSKTNEIRFVWDGDVIIQLRDSNNVPTLTLTRGLDLSGSLLGAGGIGGLLAMTDGSGATYYYHGDALGNVTALIDAYQNIVERRIYDAFGRTISLTGSKTGANPFWFSSQLHDEDTDFYHYEYRIYVPALQRWPNRDPFGEAGFEVLHKQNTYKNFRAFTRIAELTQGANLYEFSQNNPDTYIDSDGLSVIAIPIPAGGLGVGGIGVGGAIGIGAGVGVGLGLLLDTYTPVGSIGTTIANRLTPQRTYKTEACRKVRDWCDPATGRRFCVFRCDYTEETITREGDGCNTRVIYRVVPE